MGLPAAMKPETVDTIAATAPVVGPRAQDICKTFYGGMFKEHPDASFHELLSLLQLP